MKSQLRWITLALLGALLWPALGLAQGRRPSPFGTAAAAPDPAEEPEATPQAAPARSFRAPAGRAADPFAEELARAFRAEARWLSLHESLLEDFDSLPACGEQATQRIAQARDAAFETFTMRTTYQQKQAEHAAAVLEKAQQTGSSLAVDRGELEASARQIAQELEAARRRKTELASSLEAVGRSEDTQSPRILEQIIVKLEQELRLTQDTLREYDQSRQHVRAISRWARERQRMAREQLDLIKAEARLWQSYYLTLQLRLELRCYEARPPVYQFTPRSPREVRP